MFVGVQGCRRKVICHKSKRTLGVYEKLEKRSSIWGEVMRKIARFVAVIVKTPNGNR